MKRTTLPKLCNLWNLCNLREVWMNRHREGWMNRHREVRMNRE